MTRTVNQLRSIVVVIAIISPAALLAEDSDPKWTKSRHNPMLSLGRPDAFDSQNIMSPAIAKDGEKYFLFYAGGPAGPRTGEEYVRYQLGLAISKDGLTWTKRDKPILPLGKRDNFHCTPAVLRTPTGELHKRDRLWHMVYCGNREDDVEYATSRDGLTWEKNASSPIFRKAYAPNLVQVGDEIWMYYVHKPGKKEGREMPWEIHRARGRDFSSLKADTANPVLRLTQPWESTHLFYPYVIREGMTWVMFYAAYWKGHPRSTAIGMAISPDGQKWTKSEANPILTPTPGSKYDSTYTSAQSVIHDGGEYKMYYGARIDQIHKYFAIGLATYSGKLLPDAADKRPRE